jgi:hypothetical protein
MPESLFNSLNIDKFSPNNEYMLDCGTKALNKIELKEMGMLCPAPVKGMRERLQTCDMTSPAKSTEAVKKTVTIKDKKIKKAPKFKKTKDTIVPNKQINKIKTA